MKIRYSSKNGRLSAELDGETQKDLFQQISSFQEVFEESKCGLCSKEDIRFVVRVNKDNDDFFELHCLNAACRARLAFGQHKKGGSLFPHRKDKEGTYLPNNGWTKYVPQG